MSYAFRGARLTTANIAHVIFLTHDMSYSKSLSKALPNRLFRQISLSDCSPDVAKRYVATQLSLEAGDDEKSYLAPATAKGSESEVAASSPSPATASTSVTEAVAKSHKSSTTNDSSSSSSPFTSSNTITTKNTQHHQDSVQDLQASQELDEAVAMLGGRLTDLDYLARRIRAGETPKRAVRAIAEQSASEIQKVYLFSMGADEAVLRGSGQEELQQQQAKHQHYNKWTPEQAWVMIRMLAGMAGSERRTLHGEPKVAVSAGEEKNVMGKNKSVPPSNTTNTSSASMTPPIHYHALLVLDPLFGPGTGDLALASLAEADLIAIDTLNGRPAAIRPGRPIFAHACAALVADPVLSARMDLAVLSARIGKENGKVEKAEREIGVLTGEGVLENLGGGDDGNDVKGIGGGKGGMFDRLTSGRSSPGDDELEGRTEDLRKRLRWLAKKIGSAQEKIEGWESEGKALKAVLGRSY